MERVIAEKQIETAVLRTERAFERALIDAQRRAYIEFGITEDGNSNQLDEWERSYCRIDLEFVKMSASFGPYLQMSTVFTFNIFAIKDD